MPLLGDCLCAQARPCTMSYLAQPVARCWTGRACLVVKCARGLAVGAVLRWASPPCIIIRPVPIVICDPYRYNKSHAMVRDACTCLQGPHLVYQKPITVPLPCWRPAGGHHISRLLSPGQGGRPERVYGSMIRDTAALCLYLFVFLFVCLLV